MEVRAFYSVLKTPAFPNERVFSLFKSCPMFMSKNVVSCIQKRLKLQMSYLAVADNFHPMYQHSGETLEVQELRVQPYHLHLRSPIAFAVLYSATVRWDDPNIFYVIS